LCIIFLKNAETPAFYKKNKESKKLVTQEVSLMKLFKFLHNEKAETSTPEPEPVDASQPAKEPEAGGVTSPETPQEAPAADILAGSSLEETRAEVSIEPVTAEAVLPGEALQPKVESSEITGAAPAEPIQPAAELPQHSWLYRFLNFLLGRESRLGRIMRPFLRWTASIVGLFALGLLAGYLLIYRPTQKSLDDASLQLSQQKAEVSRLQAQIGDLQNSINAANQANQAAQDSLKKAQARNNLLVLIYDVANARTFLAQKDGAKVMTAMDQARTDLDVIQPYLVTNKKELADELNGRLETVRSVLVRDAQQAQVDLDSLYNALLAANNLLFSK
jgi:hypothetical protein